MRRHGWHHGPHVLPAGGGDPRILRAADAERDRDALRLGDILGAAARPIVLRRGPRAAIVQRRFRGERESSSSVRDLDVLQPRRAASAGSDGPGAQSSGEIGAEVSVARGVGDELFWIDVWILDV